MTPSNENSNVPTAPQANVSDRKLATKLSRILHAHFGHVPKLYEDLLAGGVTGEFMSPGAQKFKEKDVGSLISSIMTERYGPASFFPKFVKGKTSTHDCRLLVTNYTLDTNALNFAAQGVMKLLATHVRLKQLHALMQLLLSRSCGADDTKKVFG